MPRRSGRLAPCTILKGSGQAFSLAGISVRRLWRPDVFGTGNATQVNTITTAVNSALINFHVITQEQTSITNLAIGIIITVMIALILLGGIKRIGQVTEKLVPFMALLYIVLALGIVVLNWRVVPGVFVSIFEGAFSPSAVTGGVIGSMFLSMKKGVSRGIFSNEAGSWYRFHRPCLC